MESSVIFNIAAKKLRVILLLLSFIVFYRGHNEPGGGFIGGLVAASGYILYAIAYGVSKARKVLRISPMTLIAAGIFIAILSGLPGLINGYYYMKAEWITLAFTESFSLKLGTPLLFDLGVYFSVMGVMLTIIFSIQEVDKQEV